MQKCYVCKKLKPLTDFYKSKDRKNGHALKCKDCSKSYQTDPIYKLSRYKVRARNRGNAWTITDEWAISLFEQDCVYGFTKHPGGGIDRYHNDEGYTPVNSLPCCAFHNYAKRTIPGPEFEEALKT